MWILAALLAALAAGGVAAYEYKKHAAGGASNAPGLPASSLPVTQILQGGVVYALNVFTGPTGASGAKNPASYPALDPATLLKLLGPGFDGILRIPAKVRANVAGSGYTFAPQIDQWIVWVRAKANGQCPIQFAGLEVGSIGGVVASAVDLSTIMPASGPAAPKVSGANG